MDAMAAAAAAAAATTAADACSCTTVVDDVLPCESVSAAVRRRRIEIRRIRILANSPSSPAVEQLKRSRISNMKGAEERNHKKCKDEEQQAAAAKQGEDLAAPNLVELVEEGDNGNGASSGHGDLSACSSAADECPPFGSISVCGRRREMEDAVAVAQNFMQLPCALAGCPSCSPDSSPPSHFHFFAVYDGHVSPQAADFCKERMHHALVEEMGALQLDREMLSNQTECWRRAMSASFLKVDAEVRRSACKGSDCSRCAGDGCSGPRVPDNVGSTAVVAVVCSNQIVVANCGDSRAVLSRGGQAIALSNDHKSGRPDEMARVEAAGGKVILWDVHRILGILAMSRSIGDEYMSDYVIADPEVTCTRRTDEDECLILASDGLWDKVSNEEACDIARRCLRRRHHRSSSGIIGTSNSSSSGSPVQLSTGFTTAAAAAGTAGTAAAGTAAAGAAGTAAGTAAAAASATGGSSTTAATTTMRAEGGLPTMESPANDAACLLLKKALGSGSKDNISVVVVDLMKHQQQQQR